MTMRSAPAMGLAALVLAVAAGPAPGQAFRVKDIRAGTESSYPQALTRAGGLAFFTISQFPPTLWKTDGTAAGTALVKDIYAQAQEGRLGVDLGGRLIFAGGDENGMELWASDGTEAGTVRIKDIRPGQESSYPNGFAVVGGRVFFNATTADAGAELWMSDGTEAGTVMVKDIEPGPASGYPTMLTAVGSRLFFSATTEASGQELWRSDGTPAGTVQVADLSPGPAGSSPGDLVDFGGVVLFSADPGSFVRRLWRSDGTAADTFELAEVRDPSGLTRVGNAVFFAGTDPDTGRELWKTQGTSATTVLVAVIDPSPNWGDPTSIVDVNGRAFFLGHRGDVGEELWTSDGSGAALVKDIRPGPESSGARGLMSFGGALLLVADDGQGAELWRSDGTGPGTTIVTDINPGSSAEPYLPRVALGGAVVFTATDGIHGFEPWRSDGTPGGTSLVKDIDTRAARSDIGGLTNLGGRLAFWGDDGFHGSEPWITNGTEAGTTLVKDIRPGAYGSTAFPAFTFPQRAEVVALGTTAFFNADDGSHGEELWRSNGAAGGTGLVRDINPGLSSSFPSMLEPAGSALMFTAYEFASGDELWRSDGTALGTALVSDIAPGPDSSIPLELTQVGSLTFMRARGDALSDEELWVSDGTAAGTRLVKDIQPGPLGSNPFRLTAAGGLLFLTANDGIHGQELWRSDGTAAGTFLVKDIDPGSGSTFASDMVAAGGRVFFTACLGGFPLPTGDCALWVSDGTEAGTVRLHGLGMSPFAELVAVGSDVLFVTGDAASGPELWRSDGTPGGTLSLSESLFPGPTALNPRLLRPAGGGVLMCSPPSALWWSDGTIEGTSNVASGPCPFSSLSWFTPSGPLVYYAADDGAGGGDALWAVPLSAMTGLRVSDCTVAEGQAGVRNCLFTFSLAAPLSTPVTFDYATADGTATAGSDYASVSGSLILPAGLTSGTIPVVVNGDTLAEANEGFSLVLSNVVGANLVDGAATGTILDDEAARFHALTPCRVVDTRQPAGPSGGPPLTGNRTRTFSVSGSCGIPAAAKAVALNLTVVNPERAGNLRLYPAGAVVPNASVVNFAAGRTRANNAIASLGTSGAVTVRYDVPPGATASAHLVIDVSGYFE